MELSDLIESVDILEYISQYTEFTEKNGEYWALSPLKNEDTPSFSIRREEQSFYDFSSGIGGNVFTFIRHYHKCSYQKAIDILRDYIGCEGEMVVHKKLVSTVIAKRFAQPKKSSSKVRKTDILPDDYMEHYERMSDKLAIWEKEGISKESLVKFQVSYDRFSNRLVFPIRNLDGKIINVSGRTLDPQWKEKKLRKYTYFKSWGELNTLYGAFENMEAIQKEHEIILFEGAKSVMMADTWGIRNTGAILTSHLNPNQIKLLAKLGCSVVFALDKDVFIRNDHNIKRLKQFVKVEYIWDKDDLLASKESPVDRGIETWEKLYEGRLLWK